jgi:hypothetical protein
VPAPVRKSYKTFVVERQVTTTRERVWTTLVALLDAGEVGPSTLQGVEERVLSFEPPWRRAARIDLAPFPFAEHTIAIRDDGDDCRLVWASLVEPVADPAQLGEADAVLERLHEAQREWIERAATEAEAARA